MPNIISVLDRVIDIGLYKVLGVDPKANTKNTHMEVLVRWKLGHTSKVLNQNGLKLGRHTFFI